VPDQQALAVRAREIDVVGVDAASDVTSAAVVRSTAGLARRRRWEKNPIPWQTASERQAERIIVKLVDGAGVRMERGRLQRDSRARTLDELDRVRFLGANIDSIEADTAALQRIVDGVAGVEIHVDFANAAEITRPVAPAERRMGTEVIDVTTFFTMVLPPTVASTGETLIEEIRRLPIVEFAYFQPRPAPPPHTGCADQAPTTPVFATAYQNPRTRMSVIAANPAPGMPPMGTVQLMC
jgi:hypothetical protein